MEFLLSYRVTVPYSSVAGVYRLRCWFMDNRGVCETRLLGRQQCASVMPDRGTKGNYSMSIRYSHLSFNYIRI